MQSPQHIYLGTGGYSDTDLIGTLYPHGTDKSDFLSIYSQYYDTVEINSTFHAPTMTHVSSVFLTIENT